jgi:hypothetical protein
MKEAKLKKYWWLWTFPIAVVVLGALVVIYNPKPTPAVFDFNDGTTQGWTFDGVYDDADKKYNGATFIPTMLKNSQGKELVFFPNQLGLYLKQLGVANTCKYWRVDLVSPTLGPAWNGLKGIKAKVRDQIGMVDNVLEAQVYVRYAVGGKIETVPPQGSFQPTLPHDKWTTVTQNMTIPSGAKLLNIVLRIRGQWATPGSTNIELYEGAIYVDDVAKIL